MKSRQKIIDGKKIAEKLYREVVVTLKEERAKAPDQPPPCLAVVFVGDDEASEVYIGQKRKACAKVGMESILVRLSKHCSQDELIFKIRELNERKEVHGILLQLPLPAQMDRNLCLAAIAPDKDVDGLTPHSQGCIQLQHPGFYPCTPLGIMYMLNEITPLQGKKVAVVGYSILVGAPLTVMLVHAGATVFVCNEFSTSPEDICRAAEILVVAAGVKGLIGKGWVREGGVVIDVGIHRYKGLLVGDVLADEVMERVSYITPVPGGVGPVTVAMLVKNCLKAWQQQSS